MDLKLLDDILASIPDAGPNDLIPILQMIQQVYGYLPPDVLMAVSERTGIAASRIYGVATFYEQFHLEPHGRHTIRCCRGTACHVKGGPNIVGAVRRVVGVEAGQTTEDMQFTFETVACLGTCFLAPAMMVNNDYYGHLTAGKVRGILGGYA
ncbi:MAG: NADH-quinone oxidoreductase subunit NuoE [Planctomycetota bacterium]